MATSCPWTDGRYDRAKAASGFGKRRSSGGASRLNARKASSSAGDEAWLAWRPMRSTGGFTPVQPTAVAPVSRRKRWKSPAKDASSRARKRRAFFGRRRPPVTWPRMPICRASGVARHSFQSASAAASATGAGSKMRRQPATGSPQASPIASSDASCLLSAYLRKSAVSSVQNDGHGAISCPSASLCTEPASISENG